MSAMRTAHPAAQAACASAALTGADCQSPEFAPDPCMAGLSVDVLARHWGRVIARIDSQTIPALNKQYAKAKSTREKIAYRLRMLLLKRGVAKIAVDDAFISSIAVQQERKIRPARIAWYDGRAKLLPVRPTEIVVERKRGKVVPAIRTAQKGFARVCPVCKPDAPTPHFVRHCEAHA